MYYVVEHIATKALLNVGDNLIPPLEHLRIRKIKPDSIIYDNELTHSQNEMNLSDDPVYVVRWMQNAPPWLAPAPDDTISHEPKLVFCTKKEMVQIEIEQACIKLSDKEVREMVVRCVREKYPEITTTHAIEILSIVPSMETDVRIWRKV